MGPFSQTRDRGLCWVKRNYRPGAMDLAKPYRPKGRDLAKLPFLNLPIQRRRCGAELA